MFNRRLRRPDMSSPSIMCSFEPDKVGGDSFLYCFSFIKYLSRTCSRPSLSSFPSPTLEKRN